MSKIMIIDVSDGKFEEIEKVSGEWCSEIQKADLLMKYKNLLDSKSGFESNMVLSRDFCSFWRHPRLLYDSKPALGFLETT